MTAATRHYTFQDYLNIEGSSAVRHEFLGGEIFAMAPGTSEHAALSSALVGLLGALLKGRRCRLYGADLRIRVPATGLATYADAAVVQGEPIRDPESPTHVTNPCVIVEVLGPATQAYDRGEKRAHYQQLTSLGDYVLVAQDRREIDVYTRATADCWRRSIYGPGQTVDLPSIDVQFDVDALYTAAGVR